MITLGLKDSKMYSYPYSNCKIVIVSCSKVNAQIIGKAVETVTRGRKGSNISIIDFDQNQNAIDELSDNVSTLAFLLGDETEACHKKAKNLILGSNVDLLINFIPAYIETCQARDYYFNPNSNETIIYLNRDSYLHFAVRGIQSIVALFKLPSICGLDLSDVREAFSQKNGWLILAETSYADRFVAVQQAIQVWKPYNNIKAAFLLNVMFKDNTQFSLNDFSQILDILEQEIYSEQNTPEIVASFTNLFNLKCDIQITLFRLTM
jgi:hypothetical protein